MRGSPGDIFGVLADPERYEEWVVGAHHTGTLERDWPQPGARFRHAQGTVWPLQLRDTTEVLESNPPNRLLLEVRIRPIGIARVEITLQPSNTGTIVTMMETPINGPLRWLPQRPLTALIRARNNRSLHRLATLIEGSHSTK